MKLTRWLALLLAGPVLLAGARPAQAQRRQLPQPQKKAYIHFQADGDLSSILSEKLLQKRGEKIALDKMMEHFRKNPLPFKLDKLDARTMQDPQVLREVHKFLDAGRKENRLEPEDLKALERLLKPPAPPASGDRPGHLGPPALPKRDFYQQEIQGPTPLPAAPESAAQDPGLQEQLAELARSLAHRLEGTRLGDTMRNSRAVQDGLRNLEGFLSDQGGSKFRLPAAGLANLGERLRLKDWNVALPDFGRLKVPTPTLPSLPRPELDFSLPRFDLGGAPLGGGLPDVGSTGLAATQGLLWVGLAVLVGVLLWRLRLRGSGRRPSGSAGWQLGPWPVDPARLATRADLVRAFEYLALLRLGPQARAWNHCAIANQLGGYSPDQEPAADELAALYEQARYAPGDDPLAPSDLVAARRNLCLLAGVATA
jgi:hypothetical protein